MKVNARIFNSITTDPFDIQDIDGHHVELFYLNDYDGLLAENTAKGRFAVWSSADGDNYRLLVEKGYYETVTQLYEKPVNKIWLEFWEDCEKVSKKMYRFFLIPATVLAIGGFSLTVLFMKDEVYAMARNIVSAAILVLFIIVMLLFKRISSNEINKANAVSVEKIKKTIGAETFEDLLKDQRDYMDEYFRLANGEDESAVVSDELEDSETKVIDALISETDEEDDIDRQAEENGKEL